MTEHDRFEPADRAALRAWLEAHHDSSPGIWLVLPRRPRSGGGDLDYDAVVEEALCFGWIDGRTRPVDEERSMLLLSPRRPTGTWAASNKARIERLAAAGRMTEAGWRAVEVAKANGSWSFLDDVDALVVPDDLAAALDADPEARRHFAAFPPSARKAALYWIKTAKRPETRDRRVAETVRLAHTGQRVG